MPVSYVLSMSIRRYMEDHEGLDDSNAIGLYNLSQNAVLDLSDDVGDCTVTYDVLGTTGYTVPCVGIKTKTLTPSKELEILQRVLNERRLDAQRLDKRISPFLPTRDNHDKREVQDEALLMIARLQARVITWLKLLHMRNIHTKFLTPALAR